MELGIFFLCLPLAYLIGAVPFSFLIGRFVFAIDIRTEGSGNVGATNLARALQATGKADGAARYFWGVAAFSLDLFKGWFAVQLPVLAANLLANPPPAAAPRDLLGWQILCGLAAVLGHVFTVFLKFRGGKGVAASCGVGFGLAPLPAALALGSWVLLLILTRYISVASVAAAFLFPVYYGLAAADPLGGGRAILGTSALLAVVILVRHLGNLLRIARGTEPRWRERPGGQRPP